MWVINFSKWLSYSWDKDNKLYNIRIMIENMNIYIISLDSYLTKEQGVTYKQIDIKA